MNWIEQGGVMVWPLVALSVVVVAVLIERFIVFTTTRLPDSNQEDALVKLLRENKRDALRQEVSSNLPLLAGVVEALLSESSPRMREVVVATKGEEIERAFDKRLGVLALASRVAPLMGLLGTIIGIIITFANVASGKGAVDMSSLTEGIWQALIATAIGLCIAIPSVLAHHAFLRQAESYAFVIKRFSNMCLSVMDEETQP